MENLKFIFQNILKKYKIGYGENICCSLSLMMGVAMGFISAKIS